MTNEVIDEGFFRRYRGLLDAEDTAFDELEHAYEDGDRRRFEMNFSAWRAVVERRQTFLDRHALSAQAVAAS